MESLRQIGAGFLLGILSITVVIGGFVMSQAEGGTEMIPPSPTAMPSETQLTVFPTIALLTDTPMAIVTVISTDTPAPTLTELPSQTPPPPPASCLPPSGWLAIQVQPYETLNSLAQKYQTSAELIKQGNCLFSDQLVAGSFLYVPPRPTATFIPCGAPFSWVYYTVVPGDTLFNISIRYRTSVAELQKANCLGTSTFIQAGSRIKVPNVVPLFPSPTRYVATVTSTFSPIPPTVTFIPPSVTLTSIPPTAVVPTAIPPTSIPPTATLAPTPTTPAPPTLTPEPTVIVPPPSQTPVTPPG
jgi:LysM repeat protein